MTIQELANVVIGLALVAWIIARQLQWRALSVTRVWRLPVILGGIGIIMLAQTHSAHSITTLDITVLVGEAAISAGLGAIMGVIATIRTRTLSASELARLTDDGARGTRKRRDRGPDVELMADGSARVTETRTGGWGVALWIVMILVRIGVDMVAMELGSALAAATGVILVMIAVNRVARSFVLLSRMQKLTVVAA